MSVQTVLINITEAKKPNLHIKLMNNSCAVIYPAKPRGQVQQFVVVFKSDLRGTNPRELVIAEIANKMKYSREWKRQGLKLLASSAKSQARKMRIEFSV